MGTMLATEWRPPRIVTEAPQDYDGPVYYRAILLDVPRKKRKGIDQVIRFANHKIGGTNVQQRFAAYLHLSTMRLDHPDMFDEDDQLNDTWRAPLIANRKADFPKNWRDLESFEYCSGWVRDGIEALEPGVHTFIPVEIHGRNVSSGEPVENIYKLLYGTGGRGFVGLSLRSNPTQNWVNGGKDFRRITEFVTLDADKVAGKHMLWCEIGWVWSKQMIDRLGDVMADYNGWVAVGVEQSVR